MRQSTGQDSFTPFLRNFPISFKPKVAIAKLVWKMQKKSGIMKSGLDAMSLFLLDDLLNHFFHSTPQLYMGVWWSNSKCKKKYGYICKYNFSLLFFYRWLVVNNEDIRRVRLIKRYQPLLNFGRRFRWFIFQSVSKAKLINPSTLNTNLIITHCTVRLFIFSGQPKAEVFGRRQSFPLFAFWLCPPKFLF